MLSRALSPTVLLIDIETSPNLSYTWGKWEQDVIRFQKEWELLAFAYKELGRQPTRCLARPQFKDKSDRSLVKAVWSVCNSADVLIGHNIDAFDSKKLKAKFVEYGLPPPMPYKTIDTCKLARSQFAFNSNKLDDLAFTLKLGRKKATGGFDLWLACMAGDKKAWAKMIAYNKHDVVLLEKVYERLKAWYSNHPNLALYEDRPGCPVCSSLKVQRRGVHVLKLRKAERFQCQDCSHWFSRKAGVEV